MPKVASPIPATPFADELDNFLEDGHYFKTWIFMQDKGLPTGSILSNLPLKIESKYDSSTGALVSKAEKIYSDSEGDKLMSLSSYSVNGDCIHSGSDGGAATGRCYIKKLPQYNNSKTLVTITKGYSEVQKKRITMKTEMTKNSDESYTAAIYKKQKRREWNVFSMCHIKKANVN
jgi:hypothetical protein